MTTIRQGRSVTTTTPWGRADWAYTYGRGVISYVTPGHGGFHVSPRLLNRFPVEARALSGYEAGWFEEDCDWAAVPAFLPEFFTTEERQQALECLGRWHPELLPLIPA